MSAELPNRRPLAIERVEWLERWWLVAVGFDAEGRAREVFLDPAADARIAEAVLDLARDGAITMSHLLQSGMRAADLAALYGGEAPSLLALAAQTAAQIERALGGEAKRQADARAGQEPLL